MKLVRNAIPLLFQSRLFAAKVLNTLSWKRIFREFRTPIINEILMIMQIFYELRNTLYNVVYVLLRFASGIGVPKGSRIGRSIGGT